MMDKTVGAVLSPEAKKKDLAEKAWLHYFNETLFKKGLISEAQRNRMALKIECRKPTGRK